MPGMQSKKSAILSQKRLSNYIKLKQILEIEEGALLLAIERGATIEPGRYSVWVRESRRGVTVTKRLEVR